MTLSGLNFPFSLRPQSVVKLPRDAPRRLRGRSASGRTDRMSTKSATSRPVAAPALAGIFALAGVLIARFLIAGVLPARFLALSCVLALVLALVLTLVVVGAQAAPGEALQPLRPFGHAPDRDADAVEARGPLAAQRAQDGVLRQPGVPYYLLLPVRELPVGVGDLGIHRREFPVDLPACRIRHLGQSVDGFGAVDGGQLAAGVLRPGGRRTGWSFSRGGVDVDRDQPAPSQDQGRGGGDGPVGERGTFLARCASHGTPLLRGRSVTSHTGGRRGPFSLPADSWEAPAGKGPVPPTLRRRRPTVRPPGPG